MRSLFIAAALLFSTPAIAQEAIMLPEKLDRSDFFVVIADAGPLFIAGQPTADALKEFNANGVTTVINLRTQQEMDNRQQVPYDEAALLDELKVNYVHIPLGGPDTPYTPASVEEFATAFEAAEGKVLLHCTVAWRASHMWAAYLVNHKGFTLEEAIRHADAINLNGYQQPGKQPIELFLELDGKPVGLK